MTQKPCSLQSVLQLVKKLKESEKNFFFPSLQPSLTISTNQKNRMLISDKFHKLLTSSTFHSMQKKETSTDLASASPVSDNSLIPSTSASRQVGQTTLKQGWLYSQIKLRHLYLSISQKSIQMDNSTSLTSAE